MPSDYNTALGTIFILSGQIKNIVLEQVFSVSCLLFLVFRLLNVVVSPCN